MSKILLQTTVTSSEADWHIDRFRQLATVLQADGHDVVARNREPGPDGSDPVLSALAESDFDELWLIAAERENGLSPNDVRGILRFRERGGGVLTARDNDNLGTSLLNLGTLGAVNHFQNYNRERGRRPIRHSGDSGQYQRIVPLEPVHEVLRSQNSPSGIVEYFPAHPREGAISVPRHAPNARAIAASPSADGKTFNVAIAIESEPATGGHACGRAIAVSSFHHFSDANWSVVQDAHRLEIYKDYLRNIARWLAP